jgi:hypothetical protein
MAQCRLAGRRRDWRVPHGIHTILCAPIACRIVMTKFAAEVFVASISAANLKIAQSLALKQRLLHTSRHDVSVSCILHLACTPTLKSQLFRHRHHYFLSVPYIQHRPIRPVCFRRRTISSPLDTPPLAPYNNTRHPLLTSDIHSSSNCQYPQALATPCLSNMAKCRLPTTPTSIAATATATAASATLLPETPLPP